MKITKKNKNKIIVGLTKNMDINNTSLIKEKILNLIDEGYKKVVLDFEKVKYIDSNGIGCLFAVNKQINKIDGELKLINVNSAYVQDMFAILNLNSNLNIV